MKKNAVFTLLLIVVIIIMAALFLRTPAVRRLFYPFGYREVIEKHAGEYGVDPLLVAAVIYVESKFNAQAVSSKGARGLMQVMPATAQWIARNIGLGNISEEMLLDPDINIRMGTWYLADLSREFGGNLYVMIAAYNGGRGQVARWLEEGVWSGSYEDRGDIPFPETRHFLHKVRSAYDIYRELYS